MTFIGQNLLDWQRTLESYLYDQRPVNLEEIGNLLDVIRAVRSSSERVLETVGRKDIVPTSVVQSLKIAIG